LAAAEVVRKLCVARGEPLPIVEVEEVTTAGQHFRCEPYRATLTAGACAKRWAYWHGYGHTFYLDIEGRRHDYDAGADRSKKTSRAVWSKCRQCDVGRRFAQRFTPIGEVA